MMFFYKKKPVLFFIHIPKSAGTALLEVIKNNYRSSEILQVDSTCISASMSRIYNRSSYTKRKIHLVYGHMPYGLHKKFNREFEYITILRDPVDRLISHYYYVLRTPDHYLYETVTSKNMTLKDYVSCDLSPELDNGQIRQLFGMEFPQIPFEFGAVPAGGCTKEMLDEVIHRVTTQFSHVGLQDNFKESIQFLVNRYEWMNRDISQHNVTKNRPLVEEVDSDIRSLIEERNNLDIELVNYVRNNRK